MPPTPQGFFPYRELDRGESNWKTTSFVHVSGFFTLTRFEVFDVDNRTALIGWTLYGPPSHDLRGELSPGERIYTVIDVYSALPLSTYFRDSDIDSIPNHLYPTLQIPALDEDERVKALDGVVSNNMRIFGKLFDKLSGSGQMDSDFYDRLRTANQAGLSGDDHLEYVYGDKNKVSKLGKKQLREHKKKIEESKRGEVMLEPPRPGESIEDWLKRTGGDWGDGAPRL